MELIIASATLVLLVFGTWMWRVHLNERARRRAIARAHARKCARLSRLRKAHEAAGGEPVPIDPKTAAQLLDYVAQGVI